MGFYLIALGVFFLAERMLKLISYSLIFITLQIGCARQDQGPVRTVDVRIQPYENSEELDGLVQILHAKVNRYRGDRNLPHLLMNTNINAIARNHSASIAQGVRAWSHQGHHDRFREMDKYVSLFNKGENLVKVWGHDDLAQKALEEWIKSSLHRRAMENARYRITGIGVAKSADGKYYFTQLFAEQANPRTSKSSGARR